MNGHMQRWRMQKYNETTKRNWNPMAYAAVSGYFIRYTNNARYSKLFLFNADWQAIVQSRPNVSHSHKTKAIDVSWPPFKKHWSVGWAIFLYFPLYFCLLVQAESLDQEFIKLCRSASQRLLSHHQDQGHPGQNPSSTIPDLQPLPRDFL
jgi:hypothetical protein